MKKQLSLLALASVLAASPVWASGYRIPEQSVDATAKAGAHVASAEGSDASYYNPAAMVWGADAWQVAVDATYINLPSVTYTDNRSPLYSGESEEENFLLPTLFVVSPEYNKFRFGFAITGPYGLSKRWQDPYPKTFAEEYTLKVYDFNPTVAYEIGEIFSVAGGVRMLYSDAKVSSNGVIDPATRTMASRSMEGDAMEWGWNAALSARPSKDLKLALTYRSNVDLDLEGDARLGTNVPVLNYVDTTGDVSIPAPAVLSLSGAYTFAQVTVDLTWDRTYWSEYEDIAFHYSDTLVNPVLAGAFGRAVSKDWEDSSAYRLGLSWQLDANWVFMAGLAYDESPVPDSTIGFDLPDSDAWLYSLGMRVRMSEQMELGFGYLYDDKEDREVQNPYLNGTFSGSSAHLLTVGMMYTF